MDSYSVRFEPYFLNTSVQDTTRIANRNAPQDEIKWNLELPGVVAE